MSENPSPQESIADEFKNLGKNFVNLFKAAWESQESQQLQQEIQDGVEEFGESLKNEYNNFTATPTGQRIKTDLQDFQNKLKTGEVEEKIRTDLTSALRTLNQELQRFTTQFNNNQTETTGTTGTDSPEQKSESSD